MSLPAWERGLKLSSLDWSNLLLSRSLRGSVDWNYRLNHHYLNLRNRRSLRGSVDWNINNVIGTTLYLRRSLRGSVDWNLFLLHIFSFLLRRSLRGSVDWNWYNAINENRHLVAPCVGAWIEIRVTLSISHHIQLSLPAWERGLKFFWSAFNNLLECRSLRGSVDWNAFYDTA